MVQAIVGANWGDEGKGKITDYLAENADVVVRFQGGANAGHTIINNYGRFSLHLLPSGVFNPNVTSVLGNGVALDIPKFLTELHALEEAGVPTPKIYISDRVQVLMPYHVLQDEYEEERLGKKSYGSTKSGIAPFFSDKYAKIGLQVNELYYDDILEEQLQKILEIKNALFESLYGKKGLDYATVLKELKKQSVNTGNPNPFRARERGQGRRYVLFVDHYVPTFDKDAGSKTTYQYLKMLTDKGVIVKFLGDNFLHEEPYTSALEELGIEVLYGTKMQGDIWNWMERNKDMIDVAYLNRPHIATKYIDFIKENTPWKIIFYGHDLHFLRLQREYELEQRPELLEEIQYFKNMEFSVMSKAEMNYYPSSLEVEEIHKIDDSIPVKAITAYVFDKPAAVEKIGEEREGILFVGGFAHPPNEDAVLWFSREILPFMKRQLPELKFRIVGSHVTDKVKELEKIEGVEVLGFVSDERLHELYQESRLVIVPLRYGAGVKGKVVEALHEGAAVLTTSCGAEGIPHAKEVMVVEDDPRKFADEAVLLYRNLPRIREYSKKATEYIAEYFSPDAVFKGIKDDFGVSDFPSVDRRTAMLERRVADMKAGRNIHEHELIEDN